MTPAVESPVLKMVPLDQIEEIASVQVRERIDRKKVQEYEQLIRDGVVLDPLIVFRTEGPHDDRHPKFVLASGHHRKEAYANCGKPVAPCEIRDGGLSEALECAITSNARHGLPMTRADKRRAATLAVNDSVIGERSDKQIAKMLGVAASFINEVRRAITPEHKRNTAKKPEPAPAGTVPSKRETESPAPPSATARQRKDPEPAKAPTKAAILKSIDDYITRDQVDEQDVVALFDSPQGHYVWAPRDGGIVKLKIINRNGRVLLETKAILKDINEEAITVKCEALKSIATETV